MSRGTSRKRFGVVGSGVLLELRGRGILLDLAPLEQQRVERGKKPRGMIGEASSSSFPTWSLFAFDGICSSCKVFPLEKRELRPATALDWAADPAAGATALRVVAKEAIAEIKASISCELGPCTHRSSTVSYTCSRKGLSAQETFISSLASVPRLKRVRLPMSQVWTATKPAGI